MQSLDIQPNSASAMRTDAESGDTTEIEYYWGPDLSDTLQGAGGVGGLVAVSVDGAWYFPDYDANGNVTAYRNETRGYAAQYAYDAFGNMVLFTGPMADFFAHGFSTKYYDFEPDLYYYGYRFYSPVLGRWLSRDLIEEEVLVHELSHYTLGTKDVKPWGVPVFSNLEEILTIADFYEDIFLKGRSNPNIEDLLVGGLRNARKAPKGKAK